MSENISIYGRLEFFLYLSWPEGGYLIYSTHECKTHSTGNEGNGPYDCEINWDGLSLAIHGCSLAEVFICPVSF